MKEVLGMEAITNIRIYEEKQLGKNTNKYSTRNAQENAECQTGRNLREENKTSWTKKITTNKEEWATRLLSKHRTLPHASPCYYSQTNIKPRSHQ